MRYVIRALFERLVRHMTTTDQQRFTQRLEALLSDVTNAQRDVHAIRGALKP